MRLLAHRARPSETFETASGFFLVAIAANAIYGFGFGGAAFGSAIALTAVAVGVIGLLRNRPAPGLAWWSLLPAGALLAAGLVVRSSTGQASNLKRATIAPDLLTVPGYLLFAFTLIALIRKRQQSRGYGIAIDSTMFALTSFVLFYIALIQPVLSDQAYSQVARITFSIYPPLSAFLVFLAARLAFSPGARTATLDYLLVGVSAFFLGDVLSFLTETQTIAMAGNFADVPYGIAYCSIAAALLHPSIRRVSIEHAEMAPSMRHIRSILVAISLLLPCALLLFWRSHSTNEQIAVGALTAALTTLGSIRLAIATRAQARSEARFAYRATHDALTGLPNRELLLEALQDRLARKSLGHGVAVLLVDLDRFKLVNDTLGHQHGDDLLLICSRRLQAKVPSAGLVGRVSGDEFVIVLFDASAADAERFATAVLETFNQPFDVGRSIFLTASIGIAHTTQTHLDPATLLREADTAVYRSKDRGRNRSTIFNPEMLAIDERRVELEHALRLAIGAGALEVFFQPIVAIDTGRIEGFEALARWRTATEFIPPSEFIEIAEESGLIVELGAWVLRESCRQLARWRVQPEFAHTSVSVNLSAQQIDDKLPALVDETLRFAGLPGEALWLEMTESMMVKESDQLQAILAAVCDLGVRFSLDDFGTGFSSLSYLRAYPLDRLKIDRSFITGLRMDTAAGSLADAVVSIGRSLRMTTIAEGTEDAAEVLAVYALGCRFAQGYYFSRPVSTEELAGLPGEVSRKWRLLNNGLPLSPGATSTADTSLQALRRSP